MEEAITALCYCYGSMIRGSQGIEYSQAPHKAIRMKFGMTYEELEDKLSRICRVDRSRSKMIIIYRFPQVVQPTVMKYEPVPIADDDDMEIIFSTVNSHPCLSGAELYIELEDVEPIERHCCEAAGQDTEIQNEVSERNISCASPVAVEDTMANIVSTYSEEQVERVVTDVPEDIIREASRYTAVQDTVHADNQLFDEDDVENDDEIEVDTYQVGTSRDAECPQNTLIENDTVAPSQAMFEPPSVTFTHVDWTAANQSMPSAFEAHCIAWTSREELRKGLRFADKAELQNAVKQYSIDRHHEYRVVESEPALWAVKCKNTESGCQWRLRAIKRQDYFEITRYKGPHTCISPMLSQDHSGLDSNLIATEIRDLVQKEPTISISGLGAVVKNKFNYMPTYRKIWEAKQKAMAMIFGDWDKSYQLLPKWLHAVEQFNPGSWVKFISTPTGHPACAMFDRVFWAFAPSIEGFKYCRPVLSIDATFLYGKYRHKMLIATGVDGNNQIFPLAFAIVDEESTDTWSWFLACIRTFVTSRQNICLISDRHAGILAAVENVHLGWQPPNACHVYCLRHVASNFNTRFRDTRMKEMVKKAGMQIQVRKFDKYMQRLEKLNPEAVQWLSGIPKEKWTCAHDGGSRYGIMTTNLSECFNGVLKNARFLPVTALVQLTFFRLVSYFDGRRAQATDAIDRGERFTPFVVGHIMSKQNKATSHTVTRFDRASGVFQVHTGLHGPYMNKGNNIQVSIIVIVD